MTDTADSGVGGWRLIEAFDRSQERARVIGFGTYRGEANRPIIAIMDWVEWIGTFSVYAMPFRPTHWQPLPPPPTGDA